MDASKVKSTEVVQATQAPKRSEEVRNAEKREAKPNQPEVKKTEEPKPRPVINAQGQTTGRLLNATA
jgi:hypothetical protein